MDKFINFYIIDDNENDRVRFENLLAELYEDDIITIGDVNYSLKIFTASTFDEGKELLRNVDNLRNGGFVLQDLSLGGVDSRDISFFGTELIRQVKNELKLDQLPYGICITTVFHEQMYKTLQTPEIWQGEKIEPPVYKDEGLGLSVQDQLNNAIGIFCRDYVEFDGCWRRRTDLHDILAQSSMSLKLNGQDLEINLYEIMGIQLDPREGYFAIYPRNGGHHTDVLRPVIGNMVLTNFINNTPNFFLRMDRQQDIEKHYHSFLENRNLFALSFIAVTPYFFINPVYFDVHMTFPQARIRDYTIVQGSRPPNGGTAACSFRDVNRLAFAIDFRDNPIDIPVESAKQAMNPNHFVRHFLADLKERNLVLYEYIKGH